MTRMMTTAVMAALVLWGGTVTAQGGGPQGAPTVTSAEALVNLNAATPTQLETLPGIGPATAQRIVDYRQETGGFKKIEDLMNVRGIGEATFLKLKGLVTVSAPPSERAAAQPR